VPLRRKIVLILAAVVTAYAALDYGIQKIVILPSFVALERAEADKDIHRCIEAIDRDLQHLSITCRDYAAWDDTCAFLADSNKKYIEANLTEDNFGRLNVNLICFCNSNGLIVWRKFQDLNTNGTMEVPNFPKDRFPASHVLLSHSDVESKVTGILQTQAGPMLVASRPIITSENKGPIRGALILGRFINDKVVDRLREQTRVELQIDPAAAVAAENVPDGHTPIRIDDGDSGVLRVSTTLADVFGKPALPIRAVVPRDITRAGQTATRFALASIAVVAVVMMGVLLWLLQKTVTGPISRLTRHAVAIGRSDDLSARLNSQRRDEVGALGREFDGMVERLADARNKLLEQSYRSGLAEMASGVLHNVRNALTPMVVDVEMLRQELDGARLDQIEQATAELNCPDLPPARREDMTRFLDLANTRLVTVARQTRTRLDDLAGRARHVGEILADQENVSLAERAMEPVCLDKLVHEAEALLPDSLRQRITVTADPSLADIGPVRTHRICLLQVLANLLTNAAESISRAGKDRGGVCVRADAEHVGEIDVVHVRMRDDGKGIAPENLVRIFERRFSGKPSGSVGIGLHWCANSVTAMNGRMYAESEGIDKGACLHVLIPAAS